CYATLPDLHSFPTRRSSDLFSSIPIVMAAKQCLMAMAAIVRKTHSDTAVLNVALPSPIPPTLWWWHGSSTACPANVFTKSAPVRSEEHTSELQSLRHLVCRL